jgi:hypothetical protein
MDDPISGRGGSSRGGEGMTVGEPTNMFVPDPAEKKDWFPPETRPTAKRGPSVIMLPVQAGPLGVRKLKDSKVPALYRYPWVP